MYTVKLQNLIKETQATNSIAIQRMDTKSDIKIEMPDKVQKGSKPIKGNYKVKCVNSKGGVSYSGTLEPRHD